MAEKTFTVKLVKSTIGARQNHIASVRGLGLRKLGQTRVVLDTPSNRGMVNAARHLVVTVE